MLHPHASTFNALFEGFTQAYGVYNLPKKKARDKQKIKGAAASIVDIVTVDLWSKHLNGEQGLGIIPINEKNMCRFGAIDVDDYNQDPGSLAVRAKKLGLPLVACRTKSGGTHLYLFLTEFLPAATVKAKLETFASALGIGGSEIFPKQSQLLVERGDAGSWINMPYFGGNNTDRFAYNDQGIALPSIEKFLAFIQDKMIDKEILEAITITFPEPLGTDCPPCLNCLCQNGFPEGTRNDGLMNLAVLAKMKDSDNWPVTVDEWNTKYMDPPLGSTEVLGVIKSMKRKDYKYMCNRLPLKNFCNKAVCRTRKYGIGPSSSMPAMGTLTKFDSVPPIWFLDVEGEGRLELTTEDLQNPIRFQKSCMEQLDCMPPILKREEWSAIVASLLESVNIVKVPLESTPKGMLIAHLEEFVNAKSQHHVEREREILLSGNVWINEGYVYFRLKDFDDYLRIRRFSEFKFNQVAMILKDIGAEHVFFNINGKGCNCYKVPEGAITQKTAFNIPKLSDAII